MGQGRAEDFRRMTPRSMGLSLGLLALGAILWPALLTFDPGDWPSPHQFPHNAPYANACGTVGAWVAYHSRYVLGDGVYPLLLFLNLVSLMHLTRGEIGHFGDRILGLVFVVSCTSVASHLISSPGSAVLPVGNGGLCGFALGELMMNYFSRLGTIIVILSTFIVGVLFATDGWVLKLPGIIKRVGETSVAAASAARQAAGAIVAIPQVAAAGLSMAERRGLLGDSNVTPYRNETSRAARRAGRPTDSESADPDHKIETSPPTPPGLDRRKAGESGERSADGGADGRRNEKPSKEDRAEQVPSEIPRTKARVEPSEALLRALGAATEGPIVKFPSAERTAQAEPYPTQIENWELPSLTLLQDPEYGFNAQHEEFVREQAKVLERTLEEFRIDARVVEIDTGPVITMFELKLGAGIKVSQIAMLSNDVARALRAHAVRVVAPISGKNTVGIEVPNLRKERVRLKELLQLSGKKASELAVPLFLGKDAGGASLVCDLTKMPHLLIAGTTGSGKSVCLNTIILSVLMTKRPDHVKMILIDPKMVEMSQFKEVPHLMCPLVTDMAQAEKILEWAVTQMDERYEMLAEAKVKNIASYNELGAEELYARLNPASEQEKARIHTFLPYIVIVIDELADLMMTAAKEVEHHLSRLAQKSRAVGIHIIVATQRPEVKVVTGLIKSNLPSRICFRVASRMDSRIVLDQNGGEVLMGQGDMLFLPPGLHKLTRAQGTYLEDSEVAAILDDLTSRAKPQFHPELLSLRQHETDAETGLRDPLFEDAVRIILESRRGSVSLLQRRLTVGYSRASRLIDQMAAAGIVGEYKGSQAREVLLTLDEWEALRAQVAADLKAGYEADQDEELPTFESSERS
jgi:S-DNA-T family DNA segregation ATPase FtsK/SpoIIIE